MSFSPRVLFPAMEMKSGFGGTKRRGHVRTTKSLSTRITRLAKKMKIQNPLHMYGYSVATTWGTAHTATPIINIPDAVQEGDAYNQRFGTRILGRRLVGEFCINPTTTTPVNTVARVSCFLAQQGSNLAGTVVDLATTLATIANNSVTRIFYDKYFPIPTSAAASGVRVRINIPLKNLKCHYTGAGAAVGTGSCLYFSIISNVVTGATAPTLVGTLDFWYTP